MNVRYLPRALKDIDQIYKRIAIDNTLAADQVEQMIRSTIRTLAREPGIGVTTGRHNIRRHPMTQYDYAIFYRINLHHDTLDVLRIVHGRQIRDLKRVPRF